MESAEYDAFLSYSSADRRAAARIQAFLERYSYGDPARPVAVFRDYSDLPAGELSHRIEQALATSRHLIVVSSPAAADSKWVNKEVCGFDAFQSEPSRIIVAIIDGSTSVEAIDALKQREYIRHDLTSGWIWFVPRIRTRIELLRILAALTNKPMRDLVRWHLWRTFRNWGLAAIVACVPFAAFLLQPVSVWQQFDLSNDRGSVFAAFADVDDSGALNVAYRFRGAGPQGFRNRFVVLRDAVRPGRRPDSVEQFASRRRLFPAPPAEPELRSRSGGEARPPAYAGRPRVGPPYIGAPNAEHVVVVQPLRLTEEEEERARDDQADLGTPIPRVKNAEISVLSASGQRASVADDLTTYWSPQDAFGNPTSPSLSLPVLWDDDLGIWIGVPGTDYALGGGLWHSADIGASWQRIEGFHSVNSLGVRGVGASKSIVVSELYFEGWRGVQLEPYPSRLIESSDGGTSWGTADAPPFGSRSEVEFAGQLRSGEEVFRIDGNLFRKVSVPRWRSLSRPDSE